MSAKRRNRKIQNKRSKSDVDPYTERYRKASDAAKAARAEARSREEDVHFGIDISNATLRSVSLVPEGQGFPGSRVEIVDKLNHAVVQPRRHGKSEAARRWHAAEEAFRAEAASDGASSSASRGAESSEGQSASGSSSEPQGRYSAEARQELEEALRAPIVIDEKQAEPFRILDVIQAERTRQELNYRSRHRVFYEAEINTVPTHVDTQPCACDIRKDHWVELGEI